MLDYYANGVWASIVDDFGDIQSIISPD